VPDLGQLIVLAFGIAPGFVAAEVQSFASMRRSTPVFEKTLLAVIYSAFLYLVRSIGSWGPQFSPSFATVVSTGETSALLSPELLLRYLVLLGIAALMGLVTGRSLATGNLRRWIARATGRNLAGSTWQEFFRDRHEPGVWIQLRDGRRIVGVPTGASDQLDERIITLAHPAWVAASGRVTPMNLQAILLDTSDALLVGQILKGDVRKAGGPSD
jgi:hypothetical protein